jgi:hypothetical protein
MTSQPNHAVLGGLLGGLAGTLAMNYAQRMWTHAVDGTAPQSAAGKHDARDWQERQEGRNANELAAQTVVTTFGGRRLTDDELAIAAPLIHFTFGAVAGAAYGCFVTRERHQFGSGAAFGAAVWLLADEIAMPMLGLSRPTTERSWEQHLQSLAGHIVFGTVAEMIRAAVLAPNRAVRSA